MTQSVLQTKENFQPPNPKQERLNPFYQRLSKNKVAIAGAAIILFFILLAIFAPVIAPYDPLDVDVMNKLHPPSQEHWFGTDHQGRDILSRVIYGAQISLYVGFVSVMFSAIFGVILGIISGYYGGWIDTLIMRVMDILLAFPGILLALGIISALGPSIINVIIAVGIYSLPKFARIVRGSTLTVRKLEFVDAIRSLGASDAKIIFQHILPNIASPIIVQATLRVATAIIAASSLSFLGLGAQPPSPEWGAMLSQGRDYLHDSPHVAFFPGLAIVLIVLGFNLFGDGLRDALDPKMQN